MPNLPESGDNEVYYSDHQLGGIMSQITLDTADISQMLTYAGSTGTLLTILKC